MADWARRFARIRPRVILGYASTIARFAAFLDSQGETIGGIKGAFTTAEKLYRPQREVIERVLGAKSTTATGPAKCRTSLPNARKAKCTSMPISWRSKRTRLRAMGLAVPVDVVAEPVDAIHSLSQRRLRLLCRRRVVRAAITFR